MLYEPTNTPAMARTSNLNEELGQVSQSNETIYWDPSQFEQTGMPDGMFYQILWIYYMYLSEKEPIGSVCEGRAELGR